MFCGEVVPQWSHAGCLVEYNLLPSIALAANLFKTQTTDIYSLLFGSNMITISKQDKKNIDKEIKTKNFSKSHFFTFANAKQRVQNIAVTFCQCN